MVLAHAQAGYFSAGQAREIGYTHQAQKYHVDHGNWVRIDRGLFRFPEWPADPLDSAVRAVVWSGGRGVVSHESALGIHGLSDVDPRHVHLTVPRGFSARNDAVVVHHAGLASDEVESRGGWSVTTPVRTMLDVAATNLSQEHLDRAMADALESGLVTRRTVLRATDGADPQAALHVERALRAAEEAQ